MKKTTIINLFGSPGTGKSTVASGLMYALKTRGVDCDCPYEFPKTLAWVNDIESQKDQLYVLANQHNNIVRSYGKVDYIILDSPILLSLAYQRYNHEMNKGSYPSSLYHGYFYNFVVELHKQYDSINVFLDRELNNGYNTKERFQPSEDGSRINRYIQTTLDDNGIEYVVLPSNESTVDSILDIIGCDLLDTIGLVYGQ